MDSASNSFKVEPRIIIHGGAGNITRENIGDKLPKYRASLLHILKSSHELLLKPSARAIDVAVFAVAQLEDDHLFNCGKGAVFTRDGINELESSIMVTDGYRKRGVGCSLLTHVKNPIKLAAEMLKRGEDEDGAGAGNHCQLSGEKLEELADTWGLELVDPNYFWTKERWEQHRKGLEKEAILVEAGKEPQSTIVGDATWDADDYFPQGTVGAVILDSYGTIAVATSTGGLTNKLTGRIGDTPTLGAGFWAEEWLQKPLGPLEDILRIAGSVPGILQGLYNDIVGVACRHFSEREDQIGSRPKDVRHAIGISGTGNGDSFLRLSAARTTASIARYSYRSLANAITQVAGPGGELQNSAGERWSTTGEGEAGMIGIELVGNKGKICYDYNRGMFRALIDDNGKAVFGAFREDV
jgi:L-asparaginase